ncbi:uncharacterized protein LOC108675050 [Hyalella azteca]|uniref:Uncharacterized protein LOC108675050 n=1 Tax=Hyalella azteca TaxID=294128 RepID=A0A8B7P0A1_HYAAZ|nr:uncharacterized protein LOC108675050 [Hyalella azteca]
MTGERRKRQQRVRHEEGGAALAATPTPSESKEAVEQNVIDTTQPTTAKGTAHASKNNVATDKASVGDSYRGSGRGTSRGGRGKSARRGVATVDEAQYYEPVTIMESKSHKDDDSVETSLADELDEAPRKYKRRGIVSNWSRYDQPPSWDQDLDDGTDYLIGEDFSDVLANQSLGSGGGGHLRLRGEEGWDVAAGELDRSLPGLGALRVTDLANSLSTIPLTLQLGLDLNTVPEQLTDFYTKIADDNRRVFNPHSPSNYVEDADFVEEQIQKLRLTFFDENHDKKYVAVNKNARDNQLSVEIEKLAEHQARPSEKFMDGAAIDSELSTNFDFSKDFNEDVRERSASDSKVDLTAQMCQAFGFDIKDVPDDDDFHEFVAQSEDSVTEINRTSFEELNEFKDANKIIAQNSVTAASSKVHKSIKNPRIQSLVDENSTSKSNDSEASSSTIKLDFSAGLQAFNFGVPKTTRSHSPNSIADKKLEDENGFCAKDVIVVDSCAEPVLDLDAPIVPTSTALVTTKEDTKELEDWLDSVLDD